MDEAAIDAFVQGQIPVNTFRKTKSDLNTFTKWLLAKPREENRPITDISPKDLNKYLRSFIVSIVKMVMNMSLAH